MVHHRFPIRRARTTHHLLAPVTLKWCVVRTLPLLLLSSLAQGVWKPAEGPLMTQWAKDVSPEKVHPEYPRPQMVRRDWLNLNGLWDYAIKPKDAARPDSFDGQILVPFPIESALSGVMKPVGPDNRLWYRRTFTVPEKWNWRPTRSGCCCTSGPWTGTPPSGSTARKWGTTRAAMTRSRWTSPTR